MDLQARDSGIISLHTSLSYIIVSIIVIGLLINEMTQSRSRSSNKQLVKIDQIMVIPKA